MQTVLRLATGAGIVLATFSPPVASAQDATVQEPCETGRNCIVRELGFRPEGTIRVDAGPVGGIVVSAWDRDSVHVRAGIEGLAPDPDRALGIARAVRVEAAADGIRVQGPETPVDGAWVATLVVYVPRRSDLALTARVGPISVDGVSGRMNLETQAGPLTLTAVGGDVRAFTHAGPVHVVLAGSRWEGGGLNAETRNGSVALYVPRTYSAQLEAGTPNGRPLTVQPPATLQGNAVWIQARLGDGGAPVRVVTAVGSTMVNWISGSR